MGHKRTQRFCLKRAPEPGPAPWEALSRLEEEAQSPGASCPSHVAPRQAGVQASVGSASAGGSRAFLSAKCEERGAEAGSRTPCGGAAFCFPASVCPTQGSHSAFVLRFDGENGFLKKLTG